MTLPEIRAGFKNILSTFTYYDTSEVVFGLFELVIKPAESWIAAREVQLVNGGKTEREIELEKKNERLRKLP